MPTINVTGDYVLAAGQSLVLTDGTAPALTLAGYGGFFPTITIEGSLEIHASHPFSDATHTESGPIAFGDNGGTNYDISFIEVAAGGSVLVQATGTALTACGYSAGDWAARVLNYGQFTIVAPQTAIGFALISASPNAAYPADVVNAGHMSVSAANAIGVDFHKSGSFLNSGVLEVAGQQSAIAFRAGSDVGSAEGSAVTNSGVITVTATAGGSSTAIDISGPFWVGDYMQITNSGTITADEAIKEEFSVGYPGTGVMVKLDNSGTINGAIDLPLGKPDLGFYIGGYSGHYVENTGTINGSIRFGSGSDVYLGADGVLRGSIDGGAGSDYLVCGTGQTISGGTGDDTIGGSGSDVLDGGAGDNTVTFAAATHGVVLDLVTLSNNVGSTLTNFQNAIGSGFDDSLSGTSSATQLIGFGGNDTLVGFQGADTLDGSEGADSLVGGGGDDSLSGGPGNDTLSCGSGAATLNGGDGQDLIIGGSGPDQFLIYLGQSSTSPGHADIVQNWHSGDTLEFNGGYASGNYLTGSATDYASALSVANYAIGLGRAKFVAVAVGTDVVVFADTANDGGVADDAVILQGRTLADISIADIASQPAGGATPAPSHTPPPLPAEPAAPTLTGNGAHGTVAGNMDAAHLSDLFSATLTKATATEIAATGAGGVGFDLIGSNFQYSDNQLTGGVATHLTLTAHAGLGLPLQLDVPLPNTDVASFETWLRQDQTQTAFQTIFQGADSLGGGLTDDLIEGYGGNDLLWGGGGADSLLGGDGDDVIYAGLPPGSSGDGPAAPTWLRGGNGNDYIMGGAGYDNVNGNQGNDTLDGGSGGGDWLLGGQGNDLIVAHSGNNILNGNLGDDSVVGGSGHDSLRGGQGNDMIWAGSGGAWITGDRGDDTLVAGQGSDTFYVAPGGGHDVATGFDAAHDHVQVAAGTTYYVAQLDSDTVIDLGHGDTLTLVGVQMSTLPSGWIFSA